MAMAKKQSEYIPQKPHVKVQHTSCHTLLYIYNIYYTLNNSVELSSNLDKPVP